MWGNQAAIAISDDGFSARCHCSNVMRRLPSRISKYDWPVRETGHIRHQCQQWLARRHDRSRRPQHRRGTLGCASGSSAQARTKRVSRYGKGLIAPEKSSHRRSPSNREQMGHHRHAPASLQDERRRSRRMVDPDPRAPRQQVAKRRSPPHGYSEANTLD